jgi:hypothetical protein
MRPTFPFSREVGREVGRKKTPIFIGFVLPVLPKKKIVQKRAASPRQQFIEAPAHRASETVTGKVS